MPTPVRHLVIGGGIIGLAVAERLCREHPGADVTVVEKESTWATHQTGRNSGVIHSGLYYPPGSLKAAFCRAGAASLTAFAREEGIPHEICGKLVVATRADELPGLDQLHQRGLAHGLAVTRLTRDQAREHEPHVDALAALHVPETGIIDYSRRVRGAGAPTRASRGHPAARHRGPGPGQRRGWGRRRGRWRGRWRGRSGSRGHRRADQPRRPAGRPGRLVRGPAGRPGGATARPPALGADRPLPGRVLRAASRGDPPGQAPGLPRARPRLPVPRRPPHPRHRRARPRRPQRGARPGSRGVRLAHRALAATCARP